MLNLKPSQKVALVTGAGRNIGRAIALNLAREGFALAINVRTSVDEGQAVVDELLVQGTPAMLCAADVTSQSAVQGMMTQIEQTWGRLDVLVNNAAIRREAPIADITVEAWKDTLAVVLDGAFYCAQAALPLLRASPAGAVINIGGLTAHTGAVDRPHVVTAKAGLVGLTRALAHDLAPNITVNCVSPGMITTARNADSATGAPQHHATRKPLAGRRGTAEEVAAMVTWLASEQARFITGQVMHVNGGTYLGS
jgi:3-oxoacyl-[acyl-carrier protein] reductase